VAPCSHCQYPSTRNPSNTCDAAIAGFTADKWLRTDPAGHLFEGLTYLLQAAQEWQCQRDLRLQLVGYQVQVYAMDSVFLRTRSLFEFFMGKGRDNYCHAQCLFGLTDQLSYDRYTSRTSGVNSSWKDVLHYGSIHIQDRDSPVQLVGYNGDLKDLNDMPVDFARGILDVWEDFENELEVVGETQLHQMAQACKEQAKQDARNVVDSVAQRAAKYDGVSTSAVTKLF
jgi:hypothetical protein